MGTVNAHHHSGGMGPGSKVIETRGPWSWPTSRPRPRWAGKRVKRCVLSGWVLLLLQSDVCASVFSEEERERGALAGVAPFGWFCRSGFTHHSLLRDPRPRRERLYLASGNSASAPVASACRGLCCRALICLCFTQRVRLVFRKDYKRLLPMGAYPRLPPQASPSTRGRVGCSVDAL